MKILKKKFKKMYLIIMAIILITVRYGTHRYEYACVFLVGILRVAARNFYIIDSDVPLLIKIHKEYFQPIRIRHGICFMLLIGLHEIHRTWQFFYKRKIFYPIRNEYNICFSFLIGYNN